MRIFIIIIANYWWGISQSSATAGYAKKVANCRDAKRISKEYCWDIAWFCISKVLFTFERAQLATNMWPWNWGDVINWPSTIMHSSHCCHILSCTAAQQQTSQKYLLIGYSASKWGLHKIALNTKSTNFYKIKLFYTFFWLQQIWPKRVMTFGGSKQNRVGEIKYKTHLIQHSQKHLQQQKATNALRAAIQMSFETRNLHCKKQVGEHFHFCWSNPRHLEKSIQFANWASGDLEKSMKSWISGHITDTSFWAFIRSKCKN